MRDHLIIKPVVTYAFALRDKFEKGLNERAREVSALYHIASAAKR